MEPPLPPDYWPCYEDRVALANELLRLVEQYLERRDSSEAAMTLSVAKDIIAALVDEPEVT